jgi:hypothetical protein
MQQVIREHVLKLANTKIVKGFYPTLIAKQTKQHMQDVEAVLSQMVQEGLIKRKYQLLCHNDHCLRELDLVDNPNELKSDYACDVCGEEIEEVDEAYIREFYTGKDK